MGLLNMLMGGNMLGDPDLASDMLKDSKFSVIALAKAATETTNPELKELIESHLLTAVAKHHQLSDIAIAKGWYHPFALPPHQLTHDLHMADKLS